jgi:hypothetical protein
MANVRQIWNVRWNEKDSFIDDFSSGDRFFISIATMLAS